MDAEPALRPLCESLDRRLLRYLRDVEGLAERRGRLERRMEEVRSSEAPRLSRIFWNEPPGGRGSGVRGQGGWKRGRKINK
ncbi:hypothetical protein chiPu_0024057 [Chiloscyllium punctatum]|uniref:Uncharacterized protein n=1 Tax=Chiloscyllium punctatum TaxID=137246 RepID=A0A401TCJ7_CHIPU|nr:hypothetical protein [Chiloscyllium punctatum]